jgi:hypothetical protein
MPAAPDVSFELERFGWVSDDRLEVAGRWHGVGRKLPRPTLVVEVDGRSRRLRALPGTAESTPDRWHAAFPWEGEPLWLGGAELELGRSIVVELPRPRRSHARPSDAAAAPVVAARTPERARAPEEAADRERDDGVQLQAALDTARAEAEAEAIAARAALERAEEETAVARRALSAAREAEEDERADLASVAAELEELRGKHGRMAQELAAARGELEAAAERLQEAQTAGRDEAQRLREELASARAAAAAVPRPRPGEGPAARERPAQDRPPPTGRFRPPPPAQEPPVRAGAPTVTVTERAAAWLSGATERARGAVSSGPTVADGTGRRASVPARRTEPAAARPRADRARAALARRRPQHDPLPEPSWALRGVAMALVAVLLVALALIVSFLA